MKMVEKTFRALMLTLPLVAATSELAAQPPKGSQLPPDENNCVTCHGESDLWDDDQIRLHISLDVLAGDAHFEAGVNCHDCHGGDPTSFDVPEAHAVKLPEGETEIIAFRDPLSEVRKVCGNCHQETWLAQKQGVHKYAGERTEDDRRVPLECSKCHGENAHAILPSDDSRSPVFIDHQVQLCGGCHEEDLETYVESVHGRGLYESGLAVTASCASCHGAHGIFYAADERSTLHTANVAGTCGKCHRFVEQKLQESVHGRANGIGKTGDHVAPGGKETRTPSCTDCHQGHNLADPKSDEFRLALPHHCGNCHVDLSSQYAASLHGQLTGLGYAPGAKCSDCHGAHDILPVDDPESRLAGANRVQTCKKCHPYAVKKFTEFLPHADYKDAEAYPLLHYIHLAMEILLFSVFSIFGIHTALWFTRSSIHTFQHGRAKRLVPGKPAYVRFEPIHRILHVVVIVSFLGLALTGLPLKYSNHEWAKLLARAMGGFDSTSVWHHVFAIATVFYFVAHLVWLIRKVFEQIEARVKLTTIVFGPDSPVANLRDVVDVVRMLRWFVGLGPKPTFERWTYWEKFDYWAVFWGVGIIGTSGFMLWFPNLFCRVLPGEALNIAKVIHSEEALLATGFIFAIHFFNTHLRADKFPMDMAALSGLVSEEDYEEERPELIERMRNEGTLDEIRVKTPSRKVLLSIMFGGAVALAIGLTLLAGILAAALEG